MTPAETDIGVMTFALGKLADLLHEGKRFPEIAESKCALDAAGIIAQLPIRSLRLEAQGLIARKRRNTATTRRACFLGENSRSCAWLPTLSRQQRASCQRSISPNTMSSEPMIAETSASMCPRLRSLGRRSGMAHTRSLCFPSSFTVLACGPFSPISSANATCVPTARRLYAPSSTLFR